MRHHHRRSSQFSCSSSKFMNGVTDSNSNTSDFHNFIKFKFVFFIFYWTYSYFWRIDISSTKSWKGSWRRNILFNHCLRRGAAWYQPLSIGWSYWKTLKTSRKKWIILEKLYFFFSHCSLHAWMMRALYFLLLRYTQAAAKLGHRELRAASGTLFFSFDGGGSR